MGGVHMRFTSLFRTALAGLIIAALAGAPLLASAAPKAGQTPEALMRKIAMQRPISSTRARSRCWARAISIRR